MASILNDWQLSRKMLMAFAIIGGLLLCVAAVGFIENRQLGRIAADHVEHSLAGTQAIGKVLDQVREQRIIVYSYHNAVDPAEIAKLDERLRGNHSLLLEAAANYRAIAQTGFEP